MLLALDGLRSVFIELKHEISLIGATLADGGKLRYQAEDPDLIGPVVGPVAPALNRLQI